ncbi:hypothetical protein COV25_02240 [candidate division WWE3 bacterium CG10_big_fil_rev_8_21_14_0_10_35_32]|nr:MAG: hypothetical protein COV25_02240 [candidate division WWE3 bacterium CG10_big_fil_rev_8_21_14_0_10_35_32]
MNQKLFYLKQLNLLKTLPQSQIEYISNQLTMKEYRKRQVLFEPGDKNKVFILKHGRVEIYQLTSEGKKIVVDVLGPGSVFGDLGINQLNEQFMEATTDSLVCVIGKDQFFDMVTKIPQLANSLVKELFSKVIESEKQIAALASDNLLLKLKNLLVRLAKKYGEEKDGGITISTKFTHEQLAEMIGISRPTMTELLNKLEKQGFIKREGKRISFNPQKLISL